MKRGVVAFASGAVFSAGLSLSGMTKPTKVLAFLDVAGSWDPSLAFVMVGAIAVAALAFRASARRVSPTLDSELRIPSPRARIDAKLLAGAALFGVGWGLSGLCPGPAVVSLASGQVGAFVFVTSMIAGMAIHRGAELSSSGGWRRGGEGGVRGRPEASETL
jgi:uncharacterized membrane protein YedE/YeeE